MRRGVSTSAIVATLLAGTVLVVMGTVGSGSERTAPPAQPSPTVTTGALSSASVPETTSPQTAPPTPTAPAAEPDASALPAPEVLAAQLERTDRLERDVPLVRVLPHESTTYRVDYRLVDEGLVLVVTLAPPLNRAEQLPERQAQLAAAKREALQYLASQGAPPGSHPIEYLPPEAAEL